MYSELEHGSSYLIDNGATTSSALSEEMMRAGSKSKESEYISFTGVKHHFWFDKYHVTIKWQEMAWSK